MPTVEIDEVELMKLARLRDTAAAIMKHPKALLKLQEATKEVFPNAVTPELDRQRAETTLQSSVSDDLAKIKQELADERTQRKHDEQLRALSEQHESGFRRLAQERGYTAAGLDAVRKLMEEKGIVDHDIAADHYDKINPPQVPLTPNGRGGWDFLAGIGEEDKDLQKLIESKGENNMLLDKMASDALTEVRAGARR